jgi:hypothetical protein
MKDSIKVELDRKQKTKESFSSRTRKLFDIAKGIHFKTKNLDPTIDFPAYEATETLKEYRIKADQNRAEAIIFLRRQLTIR